MAMVCSLVVLAVVLVCVVRPPRALPEAVFAVPAAVVVIATGLEPGHAVWHTVREFGPTLAFLGGIFVLAEVAEAAGLFAVAGRGLATVATRADWLLVAAVGALAMAITTVLSLDATVVLFTPIAVRLVRGRRSADAALLATVLLANGGSTLLPVANLTNLLVVQRTGLGYGSFFVRMALPGLVAGLVITAVCAGLVARAPAGVVDDSGDSDGQHAAGSAGGLNSHRTGGHALGLEPAAVAAVGAGTQIVVVVGLGAVLAGVIVASAAHLAVGWVACGGALVLGAAVWGAGAATLRRLGRAISPGFLAFVLALAIVVDSAAGHGLARWVGDRVPQGNGLAALLGVAVVAALLANVINNLPATLLLLPVLAARPTTVVLAALLGLNIGPSLTYTGSLATLLWRKVVRSHGVEPSARRYFATAGVSTVLALPLAVLMLWAVSP